MIKKTVKSITPPIILDVYRWINKSKSYSFVGKYENWNEALKLTSTYSLDGILEKVKEATLKVKSKEAVYERDSVLFYEIDYSYPLLSCLLYAACTSGSALNVLDFGGALGSTYFQNKDLLKGALKELKWNIVEQEHFVKCGKECFETKELNFHYTIEECLLNNKSNVLLMSCVLQYLEKPFEVLDAILKHEIEYIIFDRLSLRKEENHIITIQQVNSKIYKASYPMWFFNKEQLIKYFNEKYELIIDFDDVIDKNIPSEIDHYFRGFCLRRIRGTEERG